MERERWVIEEPQSLYQAIEKSRLVECEISCKPPKYSDKVRKMIDEHAEKLMEKFGEFMKNSDDTINKPFSPGGDYD